MPFYHPALRTRLLLILPLALMLVSASLTAQPISLPASPDADAASQSRAFGSIQKLTEPTPAEDNRYGLQLELDGSTLAVSSVHINDGSDPNEYHGRVYIYTADANGQWSLQASLQTPDTNKADAFGGSLALDGDWLVVGAPGSPSEGRAYIYKRTGTVWSLTQTLNPDPSTPIPPAFGTSVAIDGIRLLVGAPGDTFASGSVYIYDLVGSNWVKAADKLTGPSPLTAFGFSVALDGMTALIGGTLIDGMPNAENVSGKAYVYQYNINTNGWTNQGALTPLDSANGDRFGFSVAVDGETALIGAHKNSASKGAGYIFTRFGGNSWSQQAKLVPAEAVNGDRVGWSVDLEGDIAVVGADGRDQAPYTDLGAVYIFKRTGTTWAQIQKVVPPELAGDTEFGGAVDIEGDVLIVGAPDKNNDAGAVYVFEDGVTVTPTPITPTPITPTPITPTPITPTPITPTPVTPTPDPLSLLSNGSFETVDPADSKQAQDWTVKNATSDKRKCKADKAHAGECFYQFKGGVGEKAKLKQDLNPAQFGTGVGQQMTLTGVSLIKGGGSAKIKVIARHADDSKDKIVLKMEGNSSGWQPISGNAPVTALPVNAKVVIVSKGTAGKVWLDNLALKLSAVQDLLALP